MLSLSDRSRRFIEEDPEATVFMHADEDQDEDTLQFGEAVSFEEHDDVKRLREFILKGTSSKLKATLEKLRALKTSAETVTHGTLAGLMEKEILALRPLIQADLTRATYTSFLQGIADTVAETPEPDSAALVDTSIPPVEELLPALSGPEIVEAETVHLPVLDNVVKTLRSKPAAVGINYKDTAEKVHTGSFAITHKEVTEKGAQVVRDLLAEALQKGTNKDEFIDTVITKLEEHTFSEPHLENVFRTNTAAALSDGQAAAMANPLVSDHFPYVAYHATADARVRKEHMALEKLGLNSTNIYRADDPTFKKLRPPWDYQCRCSWHGVTVEQAARKGVQEAIQWLERAKTMAKEKGGSFYQFLSATAPLTSEHVQPPTFEPSPEFKRNPGE